MGGQTNAVEVAIRVRNEASGALDNFGRDVRSMTQSLRTFGGAIASEINPALGTLLFSMSAVGREVKNFGLGLTALSVTGVAAAIGLATFIGKMTEATQRSVEFQRAVASLNFEGVRGQIDAAAKSLETFDRGLLGTILGATRTSGSVNLLDKIFGREALATFLQEAREGFARVLPLQQIQATNEEYVKQLQTVTALRQLETERFASFNQLDEFLKTQQAIEQSLSNQFTAEERLVRIRGTQREAEANARPGGALPGELEQIRSEVNQQITTIARRSGLTFEQVRERSRTGRLGIQERRNALDIEAAGPGGVSPEAAASQEFLFAFTAGQRREGLEQDRARLAIAEQIRDLEKDQQAALSLRVIEADRLLKIEDARGNVIKIELANLEAQTKAAQIMRDEFERTDPIGGLAKGFKDLARGAGETMQDFARNTARGMTQSFDDLFFNALTGQFKKMGDFGRQAGLALARGFSGALSELLVSGGTRGLSGLLRGGGGLVAIPTAGGTMLVPASLASAYGGGGFSAGIPAAGAGAQQGGGVLDLLVGGAGGLASSFSQYLGFGIAGGSAAAVEAAAFASAGPAFAEASGGELALGAESVGATVGPSVASLAGPVLAGIGFLASLYGAYQSRSPVVGAVTGALSGGVAGLTIGTAISPGYGTVIGGVVGLIAGAALGAGAGSLGGKRRNTPSANVVSGQRASNAAGWYASFLNQAQTHEDVLTALNRDWAAADGAGPSHGEFTITATRADGTLVRNGQFSLSDLFDPGVIQSIQVSVGPTGANVPNFELTQATRARLAGLAQQEGGAIFAQRQVASGISVATYSPFSAIARGGLSGAFYYSTEDALNRGISESQLAAMLRYLRANNALMDLIPDLTAERFLTL